MQPWQLHPFPLTATTPTVLNLFNESHRMPAGNFVDALRYWQEHSEALPVLSDPAAASDETAGPLPITLSLRYVDAAMAVTPSSSNTIKPDLLAQILLAVHHPIIYGVIEGECCWQI